MGDRENETNLKTSFDNIFNLKQVGKLKIVEGGLAWKPREQGSVLSVLKNELKKLTWSRVARGYCLTITKKDNNLIKFDGFQKDAFGNLTNVFKTYYDLNLEVKEYSLKGWNWGQTEFQGTNLNFLVSSKESFQIPLNDVSSTSLASKNEVSLEFNVNNSEKKKREDSLVEIRFYVPGQATREEEDEDEKNEDGELKNVLDKNGELLSAASLFHETIRKKGDVGTVFGESIVSFKELLCLTPRGRFELEFHQEFFRLRGKSHDYKVSFSNISKIFLVPKVLSELYMLIVGLEPPLRQGQTRYPYLIFQFEKDDEVECELSLTEEELEKYEGRLQKTYDALSYEIISDILKGLSKKSVHRSSFKSAQNQSGIKCSMKANEALVYPMEKYILSIPKPPILLPHNQIVAVTFSRVGGGSSGTKTFEVKISMDSGVEWSFSSIPREEYQTLVEYCQQKHLTVENEMAEEGGRIYQVMEDESDDDDFRKRLREDIGDGEGDSDESPDEDFVAPKSESSEAESSEDEEIAKEAEVFLDGNDDDEKEEVKEKTVSKSKSTSKSSKPASPKGSSGPKKKKVKKDPNAPKKNLSSYFFFMKEKRPEVLEKNPGISFTEVPKVLGKMWSDLKDSEKEPYEEMAKKDKIRYQEEMEGYPGDVKEENSSKKAKQKGSSEKSSGGKSKVKGNALSAEIINDSDESE
ncbi:FACT complex subunit [Lobulomyces angularis]|nr:FACT complex subunit [Lobulomyces angularis]